MATRHFLLNRVQRAIGLFQALYRLDGLAIQRGQQLQAAVDRDVIDARARCIEFTHHHHAGAAIALRAALLGARAVKLLSEIVEHGGGTALALGFNDLAVQHKADGIGDFTHGVGVMDRWTDDFNADIRFFICRPYSNTHGRRICIRTRGRSSNSKG